MEPYDGEYEDELEELEFNRFRGKVGRVTIQFPVANNDDLVAVRLGVLDAKKVRRITIKGTIDPGATQLVLPLSVVKKLGLRITGKIGVAYADRRKATVDLAEGAYVEILGRHGLFNAIVEPARRIALVGAIVLETLDLLVDCTNQKVLLRDPKIMHGAIE
jgi:predicted aspartyl protease